MQLSQEQTNSYWNKALEKGLQLIMWMPIIWLSLFFTFVLLVTLQVGHLPTYAQPDPKSAGTASLLYTPTIFLFFVTTVTVPVGLMVAINRLKGRAAKNKITVQPPFFFLGVGIFILIAWLDIAGLMVWLLD